jgi:hypothetical protein
VGYLLTTRSVKNQEGVLPDGRDPKLQNPANKFDSQRLPGTKEFFKSRPFPPKKT